MGTPGRYDARPTGRNKEPRRYKTPQDYYASRNGPIVTVEEGVSVPSVLDAQRYASKELRQKVLARDKLRCRYCYAELTDETVNIDHVTPWQNHGKTILKNLVACCRVCNKAKGNATWTPKAIYHSKNKRKRQHRRNRKAVVSSANT